MAQTNVFSSSLSAPKAFKPFAFAVMGVNPIKMMTGSGAVVFDKVLKALVAALAWDAGWTCLHAQMHYTDGTAAP